MIAIYCRQSIDKKDSISIEAQIESCKRLIFSEEYEVYTDKGFTGANTNRPQFEKLMKDIEKKKINKIIVYKVDRISRSLQDFVGIYARFEKHGIEFVSCNEQFDTSTAMGKATLQIIMVFAELERNMIQKRVKDNFYERAKKGLFLAGVAPYGFKKVPIQIDGINTQKLEIDSDHPEQMQAVKYMYSEYMLSKSLGELAKKLNKEGYKTNRGKNFTSVAIGRILRNPVYVRADADVYQYLKNKGALINEPIEYYTGEYGLTIYGTRKNKGKSKFNDLTNEHVQMNKHKGIISSSQWLSVQYELDKNKPVTNSGKGKKTWLTGLTKCGYCGLHISVVSGQRNSKRYINCGGRKANFCFKRTVTLTFDEIEEIVMECLTHYINEYEFTETENVRKEYQKENELKIRLVRLTDEIKELVNKVSQANETLLQYINDRVYQLDQEKKEIEEKIKYNKVQITDISQTKRLRMIMTEWDRLSFDQKKTMAQLFIEKIVIYNDIIEIIYK